MNKLDKTFVTMTYLGIWALALGLFTSTSLLSLVHIFLIPPCLYYAFTLKNKKFSRSMMALGFLCLVILASVLVNLESMDRPFKIAFKIKYFFVGIFGAFAFKQYLLKQPHALEKLKKPFRFFLFATSVAAICGMIGLWTGYTPIRFSEACDPNRNCGLFGMLMTYAYGLSLLLVILIAAWVHNKKALYEWVSAPWFYAFMAVNLISLYFTYTRGAWLGLIAALPFLFFKKHPKKSSVLILASVATMALSFLFIPEVKRTFYRPASDQGRIAFYETAYRAFTEKPILGFGYRNFSSHVTELKLKYDIHDPEFASHAHNNFLEHLAATGLLGALAFTAFVLFWLWEMYRREDVIGEMGFLFIVSFSISGLVQYTFGDSAVVFFIMAFYSLTQTKLKEV